MRPSFLPRLVNGPFEDPGLFVPFSFEQRALLFDLGDLHALSPRDILKTSHVFITHTHMDHFLGFDQLLRLFLGREKVIHLYGPTGFLANIEGSLAGYSWNLVAKFANHLEVAATEVQASTTATQRYLCRNGFRPLQAPRVRPFAGILMHEDAITVSCAVLDHGIACLGFSLQEAFHVNIRKDALAARRLPTGPWLQQFKSALFRGEHRESEFRVPVAGTPGKTRVYTLGALAEAIALISPGQKVTYIADAVFSEANAEKMVSLAAGSDQLFIEAAFLDEHRPIAREKKHLTAAQAGTIAGMAGVRQFCLFHHSPRYTDAQDRFDREARQAYEKAVAPPA
ncbi:MAG: ribonuclease Z [Syntrophobacterales bacterium]|nr:MAG: ribonuclease Z [Syntrophobacterales bacterium]